TPADLYEAKKSLAKADEEFNENGDTQVARDHAYIAQRKIALADARARTELEKQKVASAMREGVKIRDGQVKSTQAELETTRGQVQELQRQNQARAAELEAERQARLSAEQKLAGAMKDLAEIAAVKEEARGTVITLSGGVLFASSKDTLLRTAQTKLDQVAEALKAESDDKNIVVEGHTDSRGPEIRNQELSLRRASAVRDYLVSRGVDASKITSKGLGEDRPLVGNSTAEDRANNRRVEIIIAAATPGATR
ncbi:MAG TPA: OmpA family protein, partial [Myxococcaceae bacterium]|nr:OmpA family protein [Myxococcaceae bacterium]